MQAFKISIQKEEGNSCALLKRIIKFNVFNLENFIVDVFICENVRNL